jgi:hypothetical protein
MSRVPPEASVRAEVAEVFAPLSRAPVNRHIELCIRQKTFVDVPDCSVVLGGVSSKTKLARSYQFMVVLIS